MIRALLAVGIRMPGEPLSPNPWKNRMRFGWVLTWNGLYWHRAVGIAGADWADGNWLGGGSWHKHGPIVTCSWRRRGSLRSARQFARNMDCPCTPTGLLWPIGFMHAEGCPLFGGRDDGSPWN